MKKLVFKLFFSFVIIPSAIFCSLYYLNDNGYFNINEVTIILKDFPEGQEQFLSPLVSETKKELEKYKGLSLWEIKLGKVIGEIKGQEWVKSISLKRSFPNTLSVTVEPVKVHLLYVGKNGNLIPIVEDGKALSPVKSSQAPDVVLLEGPNFMKDDELRRKAVAVINEIPKKGSFSKATISGLHYDKKEGFWMTMIKSGVEVKLGDEQFALKSARVSKVVDYLETNHFDARVIDANLSKKVLVRLRKGP